MTKSNYLFNFLISALFITAQNNNYSDIDEISMKEIAIELTEDYNTGKSSFKTEEEVIHFYEMLLNTNYETIEDLEFI